MQATTTLIATNDYSQNHGGVPVMIDGHECSFGSVVGYALYNKEDPVEAVITTIEKMKTQPYNGHKLVWINKCGTCICGDKGYYERQEARRAQMPQLTVGDRVTFEGKDYEIAPDHNNNYKLIPA